MIMQSAAFGAFLIFVAGNAGVTNSGGSRKRALASIVRIKFDPNPKGPEASRTTTKAVCLRSRLSKNSLRAPKITVQSAEAIMLRKLAEVLDKRHERKSFARLTAAFNEQIRVYEAADFATQVGAESSARTLYHAFIACFPQVSDFVNAPHSEQSDYLNKLSRYIQKLSKEEEAGAAPRGVTYGGVLIQFWITALAWRNLELADAMAKQLEPLNRSAYETACAMGQAKPDEKVIAEWTDMFGENFDPNSLLDSM